VRLSKRSCAAPTPQLVNPNSASARLWKSTRSKSGALAQGKQALFAYMDALAKVILSTLPDTDEDTRQAATARGKIRYARFLKSAGANMAGDAQAALSELVNRAPEE
jgi:hypothetical protein